jgi:hypothetical protein
VSGDNRRVRLHLKGKFTSLVSDPVPLFPITSLIQPEPSPESGCGVGSEAQPVAFTQFIQTPRFFTLNVDKTVVVPDGGTALLSGWKRERVTCEERAVPVLSDLPFIGEWFKTAEQASVREQVMLLVTPRIIINKEEEETRSTSTGACVPAPGAAEPCHAPPPCAASGEPSCVDKRVAKLLKAYHKACARGDLDRAKKLARKALSLDPACFDKERRPQPAQPVSQTGVFSNPSVVQATAIGACIGSAVGAVAGSLSGDPTERMRALLINSEDTGPPTQRREGWFWLIGRSGHMTYERIHGGIE